MSLKVTFMFKNKLFLEEIFCFKMLSIPNFLRMVTFLNIYLCSYGQLLSLFLTTAPLDSGYLLAANLNKKIMTVS